MSAIKDYAIELENLRIENNYLKRRIKGLEKVNEGLMEENNKLENETMRMIKGGNGSHWEGCEEMHYDCKITQLEKTIKLLEQICSHNNKWVNSIIKGEFVACMKCGVYHYVFEKCLYCSSD